MLDLETFSNKRTNKFLSSICHFILIFVDFFLNNTFPCMLHIRYDKRLLHTLQFNTNVQFTKYVHNLHHILDFLFFFFYFSVLMVLVVLFLLFSSFLFTTTKIKHKISSHGIHTFSSKPLTIYFILLLCIF